ncbi:hypothetical protein O181_068486 [Austropuccinia psidii MF-1]|uniref:Retrovirus-related Pol polyprotein from transposon TNT 1-94-like beta-barrel domain-containing protein n=1 Tax=Austropuccinia psidii MF-1 TaxID=1389203 RepID=A0A9Q3F1N1_9BASI|nr:hypothetical protein [Austropuccinia psidii MF-1]
MPLPGCGDALLDLGATHSIVGNISFFTHLSSTNLTLSVASNHRFPIGGIGTIRLLTPNGPINLSNVLYRKHIPGVVISLGQLFNDNIHIFFSNGLFILRHNSIFFQPDISTTDGSYLFGNLFLLTPLPPFLTLLLLIYPLDLYLLTPALCLRICGIAGLDTYPCKTCGDWHSTSSSTGRQAVSSLLHIQERALTRPGTIPGI